MPYNLIFVLVNMLQKGPMWVCCGHLIGCTNLGVLWSFDWVYQSGCAVVI